MFCYFKCFNEANKLNKEIKDENNYINYDDLILDYIYKNSTPSLNLAEIIFPLVEDKTLLTKFIYILYSCPVNIEIRWINLILKNGFSETSQIDISAYNETLLSYSCKHGLIEVVKYLVENGANIHEPNNRALNRACQYGHLEIVKYLIESGADVYAYNNISLDWAKMNDHEEIIRYIESLN